MPLTPLLSKGQLYSLSSLLSTLFFLLFSYQGLLTLYKLQVPTQPGLCLLRRGLSCPSVTRPQKGWRGSVLEMGKESNGAVGQVEALGSTVQKVSFPAASPSCVV